EMLLIVVGRLEEVPRKRGDLRGASEDAGTRLSALAADNPRGEPQAVALGGHGSSPAFHDLHAGGPLMVAWADKTRVPAVVEDGFLRVPIDSGRAAPLDRAVRGHVELRDAGDRLEGSPRHLAALRAKQRIEAHRA